jgi:hypothetical protein
MPPELKQINLRYRSGGRLREEPAIIEVKDNRIFFVKSPFACKDDIKAMKGARWHGYETEGPHAGKKMWSIEDCNRNRINLAFMMGEDPLTWFDRPLEHFEYRSLTRDSKPAVFMPHQVDMSDSALTYHYQIWGAEMGVGKSLSAQMVIEKSGKQQWWWVGPKTSIPNIKRELRIFGFPGSVEFMTFEGLVRRMDEWKPGDLVPEGVVFDEASRLKTGTSQRSKAAQMLADLIREKYGYEGYVILMSGTPAPKSPIDWWSLCEIAWPGFLREGSPKALEQRLAFLVMEEYPTGSFFKRIGWRDNEAKCATCGKLEAQHLEDEDEDPHAYNEVAFMYERLKGLVIVKHKKDCLTLPDKRYRRMICKPNASTLRVAKAIADSAINAITGMTLLRELSDGFQYRDAVDGTTKCNHCRGGEIEVWSDPTDPDGDRVYGAIDMLDPELVARLVKRVVICPQCGGSCERPKHVRVTHEIPCPKDAALKLLLEENEEVGRIVIFAGFTGSVDRVERLCRSHGWAVVRCDGRGFQIITHDGVIITEDPLDYWANLEKPRVAFVAHPESGGMSLTLIEARMAVYWSNSWKPEYRSQSEDRIHRKGMDENLGCVIVDLIHLPSDLRVLDVIRSNRKLELMTLGEVLGDINWDEPDGEEGALCIEETV